LRLVRRGESHKTGTAASATTAETHGVFVGFAPADQPQIALVVYCGCN